MQSYAMFFAWKTTMVKKSILLKVSLKGNTIAMRIPAVCVFIIYHYVINDPKTQRKTIHLYLFHNICGQEPGHSLGGPSFSGSLTGLHKSFGEAAGCAFLSGCQTWGLISHLLAKKTSPADSPGMAVCFIRASSREESVRDGSHSLVGPHLKASNPQLSVLCSQDTSHQVPSTPTASFHRQAHVSLSEMEM